MVLFAAMYMTLLALWVVLWQKRESQFVREFLVAEFHKRRTKNDQDSTISGGGVVFVLKNMDTEIGRGARNLFRKSRASELAIIGMLVVGVPVAIAIHGGEPEPVAEAITSTAGWH